MPTLPDIAPTPVAITIVTAGALALAGCGGTSAGGTTTSSADSSPIALSQCMRSHGVSHFPDPSGSGGQPLFEQAPSGGSGALIFDGQTFSGPKVLAAEKACARFLPGSAPPPAPTAAQKHRILAAARCMRAHGVPNFPDPTFDGSRAGATKQVNPQTPAFQRAAQICHGPGGARGGGSGG